MSFATLKQLTYWFPARWLSASLPVRYVAALGRALAAVDYATARPSTRRTLRKNIAAALGLDPDSAQTKSISREVVLHYVWDQLELGMAHRLRHEDPDHFLEIVGYQPIQQALDRGFGVVIAGGHLAAFELHAAAFAWKGFPTALIVPAESQPRRVSGLGRRLVAWYRERNRQQHLGYSNICTGGALQQAVDFVDQGGVVVMGVDYPPAQETTVHPFLGVSQAIPSGAARIAIEGRARLFLAQLERLKFGQNRLTLTPVPVTRSSNPQADIVRTATALVNAYETYIRANPSQWAWLMWQNLNQGK